MRTFANDSISQIKGIWGRLDGSQRTVVTAVLLATVAGLGGILWFAGQPSYETVYTARGAEDIKQVQQALVARFYVAGRCWGLNAEAGNGKLRESLPRSPLAGSEPEAGVRNAVTAGCLGPKARIRRVRRLMFNALPISRERRSHSTRIGSARSRRPSAAAAVRPRVGCGGSTRSPE